MREFHAQTPDDLALVARELLGIIKGPKVCLFDGPVGAGKTTLIQALGRSLGIQEAITSPTYALVNEYTLPGGAEPVYHLDLYRLKSLEEGLQFGLEEYLFSGYWCFIEWPDLLTPLLDELEAVRIQIKIAPDSSRKILFLN